ncbi:MAG: serine/threonine-protein kinase [Polyangiaceae bacterium]
MQAGQVIAGKYRLVRLIGTGGMASVWSAINVFTDRKFAIKFMLPQVARNPESAHRFLLEAKVSARINHPNIIEVIDVGQAEDESLFLVMELLEGVSLDAALRRQKPPMLLRDFVTVMLDVARALGAAHASGVIHRDLKPSNIFLHTDREGLCVPKVLDFGVSKILEEETSHGAQQSLTVAGTVLGSPLYMSPEQAMGSTNVDGRSDVFAFGGILFEALAGHRAYDATNFNALIVAIATTAPKSIDAAAPTVPEELRAIVRDCMVTDRKTRLGSFDVVASRLAAIAARLESSNERLPAMSGSTPADAHAAPSEAIPVVRKSDRPPPPGGSRSTPPPALLTGTGSTHQAFAASWGAGGVGSLPKPTRRPMVIGISAFVLTLGAIAAFVITTNRPQGVQGDLALERRASTASPQGPVTVPVVDAVVTRPPTTAAAPSVPGTTNATSLPSPSSRPSAEPPTLAFDALPTAVRYPEAPAQAPRRRVLPGTMRPHGGRHRARCHTPRAHGPSRGRPCRRMQGVVRQDDQGEGHVSDGATVRHQFAAE